VVVGAEVPAVGRQALPGIESKLRSLDPYSAWRLHPDLQVGIVHVKSHRHLDDTLATVRRLATNRVGVSARFDDLRDASQGLHFAKVMLRGRSPKASPVAVFDGSILATAAVAAPEVMVRSIETALGGFHNIPDDEREMLLETYRVWQDSDASVRDAADALTCHANTWASSTASDREMQRPIPLAPKGRRRTIFGLGSGPPAHVAIWTVVENGC
jgi:hypothetical protein